MLKIFKNIFFLILILFLYGKVYCAELKVFTDSREVEINKTFNLTVEISDDVSDFKLPKMPDFVIILKDTFKGNGKIKYIYEIAPKEEGIFSIPSITLGQTTTIPISIRVYKKKQQEIRKTYKDSSSSVEAGVDTNIVYVNQLISYTLKFRTNRDLRGNPSYTLPMFQDFWKSKSKSKSGYRLINGENYFTFEVTTPLYPIRDGILTIDSSSVSIQYLNSSTESKFETKKVNVKVLPLPELGKPDFFSGAVGRYDISATVSKKDLKINEPLVLTITIRGNGNINSISEPRINLANDIKKYATTIKTNVDSFISSKEFQCVLIPLMEGEKIIPEITFSYFEPDMKEYKEISTKQIKINVSSEKSGEDFDSIEDIISKTNKEEESINTEIDNIYIKTELDVSKKNKALIKNKILKSFVFILILLIVISFIYRKRLNILSKDLVRVQKIKFTKLFIKYFQQAQVSLSRNIQFNFYYNADLALRMLLASKTNYNYMMMTKDEIKENLLKFKVDENIINGIIKFFVDCDKFKFTFVRLRHNEMKISLSQLKFIKEQLDKIL